MNSTNETPAKSPSALLYRIFWRLHFWSGLLTAPIILFAALSGILYIFSPQIEARIYRNLDIVSEISPALSLDQQVTSAQAALPGRVIKSVIPAYAISETTQVIFGPLNKQSDTITPHHSEHAEHNKASETIIAYVNPGTSEVQGSIAESARFKNWARKLHSSMLQNDHWRWLIELGASWMLLMMITGIYLWWPRGKATWSSVFQWTGSSKTGLNTRANWRYLHSIMSVALGAVTIVVLLTGITWSKYAGSNFRAIQAATQQNTPRPPRTLISIPTIDGPALLSTQTIYDKARQIAPDIQLQLTPPSNPGGVWRIENYDRSQPKRRFQLILDAYTGKVLYQSGWSNLPMLAQATAIGIPFHRGEFGWWNQALLLLVGFSVIFSVVSGYIMWLQRRKAASLSAPKIQVQHVTVIPWWMWATLTGLGVFLPTLGLSLLAMLILEASVLLKQRQTS